MGLSGCCRRTYVNVVRFRARCAINLMDVDVMVSFNEPFPPVCSYFCVKERARAGGGDTPHGGVSRGVGAETAAGTVFYVEPHDDCLRA